VGVLLDAPVPTGSAGGLIRRVAERLAGFAQTLRTACGPRRSCTTTRPRVSGDDADRLLYIHTARAGRLSLVPRRRQPRPRLPAGMTFKIVRDLGQC